MIYYKNIKFTVKNNKTKLTVIATNYKLEIPSPFLFVLVFFKLMSFDGITCHTISEHFSLLGFSLSLGKTW